jgi:hypothetical protein
MVSDRFGGMDKSGMLGEGSRDLRFGADLQAAVAKHVSKHCCLFSIATAMPQTLRTPFPVNQITHFIKKHQQLDATK